MLCLLKSTQICTEVVETIQHMPFMNVVGISKKPVNLPWDRCNLRNLFNQENTLWKDTQSEKPTAEVWTTRHEKIRLPGIQVWAVLSQTTKEAWLHGLSEQLTDLGQEITRDWFEYLPNNLWKTSCNQTTSYDLSGDWNRWPSRSIQKEPWACIFQGLMPNELAKQKARENHQESQTMGISFDKNTQATLKISKQLNSLSDRD